MLRPETIIWVASCFSATNLWKGYEFLIVADVIENLPLEDEKASVDPHTPIVNGMDLGDHYHAE
jgi:hypothetical protein